MKTPVVLISGLLSNQTVWKHALMDLRQEADFYTVSPTQDSAAKMVEEILHHAPPTFALAGHSMGGWLCLEVLRKASSRVMQLCLLNTTARADSKEKAMKRQTMISRAKEGNFDTIVDQVAEFLVFQSSVLPSVKKMFHQVGCDAFIRQEQSMLHREECLSVLPTILCPTLVIHAANDRNFSLEEHEEMAQEIPNAHLEVIPSCGHVSPMEQPHEVTSLLRDWLTSSK